MRIEQLEQLAAVTQHGSLRRASERLHLSQPALGESITKLERELGVTLLDRRRSGARISAQGRDLLHHMVGVLEAVDRLKEAAGDRLAGSRVVRVGTVQAATAPLLAPAVRAFQAAVPGASVDVVTEQQADIQQALLEGSLDLGLVNVLDGDDRSPGVVGTDLLRGRPVVVLPAGHPLAGHAEVTVEQLRRERFVLMRAGYLMHRFAHRLFGADLPRDRHTTDGAELGKLLVVEGLGVTVLPEYSVVGDPLERAGLLTTRPIAGDQTGVTLVLQRRRADRLPDAVRELHAALVAQARSARA